MFNIEILQRKMFVCVVSSFPLFDRSIEKTPSWAIFSLPQGKCFWNYFLGSQMESCCFMIKFLLFHKDYIATDMLIAFNKRIRNRFV